MADRKRNVLNVAMYNSTIHKIGTAKSEEITLSIIYNCGGNYNIL